jgi:glucose/arabinose dehydrogenase
MKKSIATCCFALLALAGCGGGSDTSSNNPGNSNDSGGNQLPVPSISAPADGVLFSAGQSLTVTLAATDAEDGSLPATSLTWWATLHHDTHTHPFQPETTGNAGTVTIPTRGETSDDIFYRFHLRATDSAGSTTVATRDVMPRKARVALLTQPAGLALTLDGQPVNGGHTFTGVVGIERDLGAADQSFNGRRYKFTNWSDKGAATHTLSTPVADTTLTATFQDIGAVNNQPPTVSLSAPTAATTGLVVTLNATAADSDGSVARVAFYDGNTLLGEDTTAPYTWAWTPRTTGNRSLTARATDDGGASTTSTAVVVAVSASANDTEAPVVSVAAPVNFAAALSGNVTLTAVATDNVGVTNVELQLDGVPLGAAITAPPYSVNINTAAHASGQHVLRARASDAAGNRSAWAEATVQFGGSRPQPAGITRDELWLTGLDSATAFAQAPDGRIFVTQQGGALRVIKNGVLQSTPFVTLTVDPNGERGLLGVAFHPNFANNRHIYVYYTSTEGGIHNRISRFTASAANPDVAQAGSELKLIDLPNLSSATNHNGGALHFGTDGKLYVGVGDNANSAFAPDLTNPFGKLLRFNAPGDATDGSIPTDNPHYATQTGLARAIWARGLRNPFTFAVQPGTGRIHINDVGQGTWEEINLGAAGADYGWPASEGPDNVTGSRTGPLFAYKHSAATPAGSGPGGFFTGFAIAGGSFYPANGPLPAPWKGSYFFADYVSKFIGAVDLNNGNAAYAFGSVTGSPVDVMTASDGALLVLTRGSIVRFSAP